ncbi:NADP-dependent oxidoreductase [Cryptosporangium japonicum]|uniref:NADP-dependent oxidoreductase n=1 Tax=Cryptosporangium japonicum TaxID=80872 RepID=A0ABN0UGT8_9ACTN
MKAVRYASYGPPSVLEIVDAEPPVPSAGQVLVRTAATSFNLVDAVIRSGVRQQAFPLTLPYTPGIEVAGTVVSGGRFAAGDAVIGLLPMLANGAAAEYVAVDEAVLAPAPTSVPLADAAAFPVGALTAWQGLFEHADVRAGQRVLVNGAGGTVGGYAVQLAARAGAHVIASASPRSAARVRRYGAAEVVDHTVTPVGDALTAPVDVVFDVVPRSDAALVSAVAPGGSYVTASTEPPSDAPVRALRMFVRPDAERLAALAALVDAGELDLDVAERLPLSELVSVHERAEAGKLTGKVVLVP